MVGCSVSMLRFGNRCFAPGKGSRSVPAVRDRLRGSSRPLGIAVLFLLAAPVLHAQEARLVILEKAHSLAGFYTLEGQRVGEAKVGPHPHEMVASPDGRFLYTTDNGKMRMEDPGPGGNTISIVEIETRRKVGEIKLGENRRPHGMDLDPRTNRLVVTTENPDQLLLIELKSRRILRRHDTKGKTSHMVTLGPRAQWAYVSNSGSGNVSAIHVATGEVKLIPTGERTQQSVLFPRRKAALRGQQRLRPDHGHRYAQPGAPERFCHRARPEPSCSDAGRQDAGLQSRLRAFDRPGRCEKPKTNWPDCHRRESRFRWRFRGTASWPMPRRRLPTACMSYRSPAE